MNNNEVFLQVTNHTGQVEKNLLGPAGIRTRDFNVESHLAKNMKEKTNIFKIKDHITVWTFYLHTKFIYTVLHI